MRGAAVILTLLAAHSIAVGQWTTSGSNIYYNGGNVGIGTSTPQAKLDVNGSINISGDYNGRIPLFFNDQTNPIVSASHVLMRHTPQALNAGDTVPSFSLSYGGNFNINHPFDTQGDYGWIEGINVTPQGLIQPAIGGIGISMESTYDNGGTGLAQEFHLFHASVDGSVSRFLTYNGKQDNSASSFMLASGNTGFATQAGINEELIQASSNTHHFYGGEYLRLWSPDGSKYLSINQSNSIVNILAQSPIYIGSSGFGAAFSINNPTNNFILNIRGNNVGVGTASPAYPLDVNGTANASAYRVGGTTGMSVTKTIKGSDGNNCTMTFTSGLLTSTTCP